MVKIEFIEDISHSNIGDKDSFYDKIESELDISNSGIKIFPDLSRKVAHLEILRCDNNELENIDLTNLKNNILLLTCTNNKLMNLDLLSFGKLYNLDCSNDRIVQLKNLPDTLGILYCKNNQIESL